MATHTTSADGAVDTAVLALHSAIRRRGVAVMGGDRACEVRAEHNGRCIDVRFQNGAWVREVLGTGRFVVVQRAGCEEHLARWIANELLGQL